MVLQDLVDFVRSNNGVMDFSFHGACLTFTASDVSSLISGLKGLGLNLQVLKVSVNQDSTQTLYVSLPIDDLLAAATTNDDQVAALSLLLKLLLFNTNSVLPAPQFTSTPLTAAAATKPLPASLQAVSSTRVNSGIAPAAASTSASALQ